MSNTEQRVPVAKNSMVNERSPSISDSSEDFDDDEEEDDPAVDYLFNKSELTSKLMLSGMDGLSNRDLHKVDPETQARLEALLEAAGVGKLGDGKAFSDPEVLRRLTSSVSCALDEAAAALTRMRAQNNVLQSSGGHATDIGMRSLAEACLEGDVNAVKKLLEEGWSVHDPTDEGESLLSLACSAGYFELVQVLLAMNAAVDDRGNKGDCTPLMEAASGGYIDIVKLLLDNGADVNAKSQAGNTALIYACCGGYEEVVEMLLEHGGDIESHNENGHTPLMEAASGGHVAVAKLLLDKGACINSHSNEFKESALTLACYKGHLDMVKFLLDAGADQEHKTDEMHTALMEASMDGHVEVARLLLDHGAQVNMPADSFESPLTLAACGGHVELAQLLIERGAHLEEVNDEGYTPLMEAAREGHLEMVALLLRHGANIHAQTEETQETALSLACCGGFQEVAAYLLKAGAQIEQGASTPLMEAAQEGHVELVKFLLGQGCPEGSHPPANVHATTATGDTALSFACENGHTDVADVLLNAGAELEQESEGGRTPLMKAARAGHLCTVQFLISRGADVNRQTTTNDHTVLSLACAGGHQAVVELLLAHGADPSHKLKDNSTMLIESSKGGHTSVACLLLDTPLPMDLPLTQMGTPTTAASIALPRVPPTHPNYLPGLLDDSEHGVLLPDSDTEDMSSVMPHISTCSNCAAQTAMITTATGTRLMSTGVQTDGQTLQEKFVEDGICDQINTLNELGVDIEGDVLTPPAPFSVVTTECLEDEEEEEEEEEDEDEEDSDDDSSPVSPPGTCSFPLTPTPSPTSPQFLPAIDIDEETDSNHDTALTFAGAGGHDELVLFLLSRAADIEHRDKKGCTPLILAATAGHTSTVEMLLDHKADIEAQSDRTKDTALSLACSGGRQEVVELLLARGANFEHRNVSDYTPLSLAASGGYIGIIKVLLNAGAEINSRTGSKLGISPLMLAAMNGHTLAVKLLLDMGSDINAQIETNRNTALTLACFQGRHEVVSLLLDRKANIEHRAKTGLTPLMEAASGGYVEVGRILLDRGADVNAPPVPSSRDTALTIAADKGHYKFCELLLSRSAMVDVKNKKGASPLWLAANGGHLDVCQLLASYGGDVDSQDHRKVSVLMASFRKGHIKAVKWLVKHVSQFPSDSDCTRYISTITDKDLLKKCHQCMEIIVTAKDRQAAEANKNASILLEELNMEKEREELKKAAAQRKRDKKKQKKKKKLQAEKDAETNEKNKQDHEFMEGKIIEDANEKPLDSSELEVSELVSTSTASTVHSGSPSSSPVPQPVENRRRKSSTNSLDTLTTIAITAAITAAADSGSIDNLSAITTAQITKEIASSIMSSTSSTSSSGLSPITVAAAAAQCVAVTLTTSSTPTLPISSVTASPKPSSNTLPSPSRRGRKEDGWKEVVRRGTVKHSGLSLQQGGADTKWNDPLSKRSKKITVSSSVISRVIGRGGCNINAIRETTGAHIDIDTSRQKVTGSCIVTIKGHPEATLQAHQLIQALIKDPECDLNDVLPKKKGPTSLLTYVSSLPPALLKPPSLQQSAATSAVSCVKPISTTALSSSKTVTNVTQSNLVPATSILKSTSILGAPPVSSQRTHQRPLTTPSTGIGLLPTPRAVGHTPTYTHPLVAAQVAAHMRQAGVPQAYTRGVPPMTSAAFNNINIINARWGLAIPNLGAQSPKKQRIHSSTHTSTVSTSVTTSKTVTTTSVSQATSASAPPKQGTLKKQTSPVARQLFPPKSADSVAKSPRKSSNGSAKRQPPSYSMAIAGGGLVSSSSVSPETSAVSGFSQAHLPGMQNGSMEDMKADLPPVITNLLSQFDQSPNFWNNMSHQGNPTTVTVTTSVTTTQTETVVQSAAPGTLLTQTAAPSTSPQKPSPPQSSSSQSSSSSPTPAAPVVNGLPESDRPSLPAIGTERASRRSVTSSPLPTIPGITPMYQTDHSSGSPPPGLWSYSYNTDTPLSGGWSSAPSHPVVHNTEKDRQPRGNRDTHNLTAGENLQTFLEKLALSDHLSLFQRNEIDLDALVLMSEKDYADIGLPEGPSSKILNTTRRMYTKRHVQQPPQQQQQQQQQKSIQPRLPAPSPVLVGEAAYQNKVLSQGTVPPEQPLFSNRLPHPHPHPHPHSQAHPQNLTHPGMNPGVSPHALATSQPWNLHGGGISSVTSVTMMTTSGDPLLSTRSSVTQETKVNGRGWKAWSSAAL